MEMNALMQALVKDLAEQMRPMVIEQIATWAKDNLLVSLGRMEDNLDEKIGEHFSDNLRDGMIEHLDDSLLTLIVDKIDMVKRARRQTDASRDVDLTDLAQHLTAGQLEVMARHVNLTDLAAELGDHFADDIAEHINLSDLASEISLSDLASEIDLDEAIKSFFSDNQVTISF